MGVYFPPPEDQKIIPVYYVQPVSGVGSVLSHAAPNDSDSFQTAKPFSSIFRKLRGYFRL